MFSKGDRVVCIEGHGSIIVEGEEYTVVAVRTKYLNVRNKFGSVKCGWLQSRFQLVEDTETNTAKRSVETFHTGAKRENKEGKGDQVAVRCGFPRMLTDLAIHMENPYGRNWELGLPLSGFANAAERHWNEHLSGNGGPKALISAIWNLACYYETLHRIENGNLPAELDDIDRTQRSVIEYIGGE